MRMELDRICRAFCDNLTYRSLPAGYAISTGFTAADGDRIAFFVHQDHVSDRYRIEDSGMVLPMLEASGFDRRSGIRAAAMTELLAEYGVDIDNDAREFFIDNVSDTDLPAAAMRFVAFSLRVRDLSLLTELRVATTFREDVKRMLGEAVSGRATIEEDVPIHPKLADFTPDFVIRAPRGKTLGLWLGTSDAKVLEALFVQMRVLHEVHEPCTIAAMLERGTSVTGPVRQQATNRLAALPEFRGDEAAAIQKIADEVLERTIQ